MDRGRRKRDRAGEVRAMSDEEAGSNRSLVRDRIPTPETMRDGELSEGHDAGADRAWRAFRRR